MIGLAMHILNDNLLTTIGKVEFPDPEVDEDYIAVFMHTGACDEYTHVWTDTHTRMHRCIHMCGQTHIRIHRCTNISSHTHTHNYIHTRAHTHMHMHTNAHTRTNTGMNVKIQKQPTAT